jgi:hypothetical protein
MLGDAAEHQRSKERQEIITLRRDAKHSYTPKEVAELLDRGHSATKKLMWTMAQDGELCSEAGRYSIPAVLGNPGNQVTSPINPSKTNKLSGGYSEMESYRSKEDTGNYESLPLNGSGDKSLSNNNC